MERAISILTVATVVASMVSVALSSILFGLALLLWLILIARRASPSFRAPPFTPFLIAYALAIVVSILFSHNPGESWGYLVKLLRLAPVFLILTFLDRRDLVWTLCGVVAMAALSAVYALLQYTWLIDVDLLNRIRGFMGHWMTFSGQMMMVLVALAGLAAFRPWARKQLGEGRSGDRLLLPAVGGLMVLLGLSLLLTFTRNAWLGCFVGFLVLLALFDWRWLIPFAAAAVLIFFLFLPEPFQARLLAGLDLRDTTNKGRVELIQAGLNMVRANPLTGVGPRMVPRTARFYAPSYESSPEFPAWLYQHLHNTPLQVAAETGLIALAAWLGWWIFVFWDLLRRARDAANDALTGYLTRTGVAVLAAFLTSGLLEYNFGDSELLTLLLFFITAPYAALRNTPTS